MVVSCNKDPLQCMCSQRVILNTHTHTDTHLELILGSFLVTRTLLFQRKSDWTLDTQLFEKIIGPALDAPRKVCLAISLPLTELCPALLICYRKAYNLSILQGFFRYKLSALTLSFYKPCFSFAISNSLRIYRCIIISQIYANLWTLLASVCVCTFLEFQHI